MQVSVVILVSWFSKDEFPCLHWVGLQAATQKYSDSYDLHMSVFCSTQPAMPQAEDMRHTSTIMTPSLPKAMYKAARPICAVNSVQSKLLAGTALGWHMVNM